jgi:hypothetical protein
MKSVYLEKLSELIAVPLAIEDLVVELLDEM